MKLLATLNYETGQIDWVEDERYNAKTFLAFLRQTLVVYPIGKVVMVLGNARIHHARFLQHFLKKNKDRPELVFLPPYSPQLNLAEGLWRWLKADIINNVFIPSVSKIREKVAEFMAQIALDP